MKKFSTATLILALATALTVQAAPKASADKKPCALKPDAPDSHVVVKGDTLWGIAGKFLERPWCWPQVWGMNREQIRNPHWIYPGQTVYLDRATGRLRLGESAMPENVRLSPQVRVAKLGAEAVPTIPTKLIEPFLSQPLIVEEDELAQTPYVVATQEDRVKVGAGDRVYVRGDLKGGKVFNVFRQAEPLKDPETDTIIGYEAAYVGTVQLVKAAQSENEAHGFNVLEAKQEMGKGDRLVVKPAYAIINYAPHSPEKPIEARIVSVYGGVTYAGQYQAVAINRGKNSGIDVGTVLKLYRLGETIADEISSGKVKLPDEESGTLFVFRVFNNVSYALIMESTRAVVVGDVLRSPD